MLNLTKNLKSSGLFKVKPTFVYIDNLIFRFHYRFTCIILLIGVALISSQEYMGESIRCVYQGKKDLHKVIERFCFFMTTFTVIKHLNESVLTREIAHPGVGPFVQENGEGITRHSYYQWVPFFLFFQAICFYVPHIIWKEMEKGKLKYLVNGFKAIDVVNLTYRIQTFQTIELGLKNRLYVNRNWTFNLILCECLNLINLIFQIYLTNVFLGYKFISLGSEVYWDVTNDNYNPLDAVFPKVTKCTFTKFGPTGSLVINDILCVMALNVVNEKLFILLWYWYLIILIFSVSVIVWRMATFLLRKWTTFDLYVFKITAVSNIDYLDLLTVMKNLNFSEWTFLRYIAKNMDGRLFGELLKNLAESFEFKYSTFDQRAEYSEAPQESKGEETKKPLVDL